MADIFISYKSEDREPVEDIVNGLKAEGVDVWWDQGIAPTADWRAEIHRQLQSAKVAVVIWSRASSDLSTGKWVIQEAEEADARGALVPVCIDDVPPPLGMRHVQAADLIDWRGDRQDPRWRGFVETVRAKLEGRPVDAAIARDTGPQTAGSMLRGRTGLLILALGLAALVVASTIAFGPLTAAALVGGFLVVYFLLNLLFARRKGERAAANFFRRAFSVGWVTVLANVVVWLGVAGVAAYPYARGALYEDMSIAVMDELRRPVAEAQIVVALGERRTRVPLNDDGVGVFEYPLYWGPTDAIVTLQHLDFSAEQPITREPRGRFSDLTLGAPSGAQRFRITHLTLEDLAIDMIHQGRTPPELAGVFPNIVGVVRNAVWETTEAYLALSYGVGGEEGIGVFAGETLFEVEDGETRTITPSHAAYAGIRSVDEDSFWFYTAFNNGIEGCPVDQPLDGDYRLAVNDEGWFNAGDLLGTANVAALQRAAPAAPRDEDGRYSVQIFRLIDAAWLNANRANIGEGGFERAVFYADRALPAGVGYAELDISSRDGCGGASEAQAHAFIPAAKLRVSIIENSGDEAIPIDHIVQRLNARDGIAAWQAGDPGEEEALSPWPGGSLAPGEAIAVPRRLIFEEALSPDEVAAFRAVSGAPTRFDVVPPHQRYASDPFFYEGVNTANQARAFTIGADQIAPRDAVEASLRGAGVYAIGPSVESISMRVNEIDFPLREDEGRTLAVLTGALMVGSCPFVFSAHQGSDVMFNRGQIIRDQIGASAEAADRVYLGRTASAIEIRELEPEITYLNRVRLIVRTFDGAETVHRPSDERLVHGDASRVVLRQGESIALSFPTYTPAQDDAAVLLEVRGYYDPIPGLLREQLRLARR